MFLSSFRVLRSKFLYMIFSLFVKNLKTILEYQELKTWIILINISLTWLYVIIINSVKICSLLMQMHVTFWKMFYSASVFVSSLVVLYKRSSRPSSTKTGKNEPFHLLYLPNTASSEALRVLHRRSSSPYPFQFLVKYDHTLKNHHINTNWIVLNQWLQNYITDQSQHLFQVFFTSFTSKSNLIPQLLTYCLRGLLFSQKERIFYLHISKHLVYFISSILTPVDFRALTTRTFNRVWRCKQVNLTRWFTLIIRDFLRENPKLLFKISF